jgi:pimeloyl-ACP methyl ester carboxylesterase
MRLQHRRVARSCAVTAALAVLTAVPARALTADRCLTGVAAVQDLLDIAAVRAAVETACPCAAAASHGAYVRCAGAVVDAAVSAGDLRRRCRGTVRRYGAKSTCGHDPARDRVVCVRKSFNPARTRVSCTVRRLKTCVDNAAGTMTQRACRAVSHCVDAADTDGDGLIAHPADAGACRLRGGTFYAPTDVVGTTIDTPSLARPPHTPGTPGVTVTAPKLLTQFGNPHVSLNNARYTRFRSAQASGAPDAILILVPGFEGGANDFKIFAENLIPRARADHGQALEVWAFDRRTNQLEDTEGLDLAEALLDAQVALDWLFGAELGLTLHPALAAGPNRRAVFHGAQADVPFLAGWTNLVFSRDIDAVVELADAQVTNHNVFLGGHSAGTGFVARYAATDFDLTGVGPPEPGYAKLRGLVLLEGAGGSTGASLSADTLDRIEAKFDGGLFGAVRDSAPRCVDGVTPCTIATETADCAGQIPPVCTEPTTSYATIPILNPRILASVEPAAIQGMTDPDGGQIILQVDQGAPGNDAIAKVPALAILGILPQATVSGGIGSFIDDDGAIAAFATFVASSVGAPGPTVGGLLTWLDVTEGPLPGAALPHNGPPPTTLPGGIWGQEKEVTRFDRMMTTFFEGASNFVDWYYPNAGPSTTSVAGRCSGLSGTCTVGDVGAPCSGATQAAADAVCSQAIALDSTQLSVGRGRRNIENLTQAANIDIPVICLGGSNGLTPVPGHFVPFATSIGTCAASSCDGTPRVVDEALPNPAFPTFGDVDGGFEVYISEGFAHVDVTVAEDGPDNAVLAPVAAFLARNAQ